MQAKLFQSSCDLLILVKDASIYLGIAQQEKQQ